MSIICRSLPTPSFFLLDMGREIGGASSRLFYEETSALYIKKSVIHRGAA